LMRFKWQAVRCSRAGARNDLWYARTTGRKRDGLKGNVSMHRMLMGFPASKVDHRDGNGLNNCRSNLRICSDAENARNRKRGSSKSGYIGVWFELSTGRYVSEITVDSRLIKVGRSATAEDAAKARDAAARLFHCEFAVLNFPSIKAYDMSGEDPVFSFS
jgi:HNH endonuclease/AP2 domain